MTKNNLHIGSAFDDFLKETGDSAEVSPVAIKRVVAWQVSQKMEKENISKTDMAKLMDTSRSALDRLLDPTNTSVTLHTLDNAAKAIITLSCYEVCCHKDRLYSRNPAEVDSEDSLKQNGYKFRYSAQFW